nr:uncharacterized protein LOC115267549 isoform X3 [Aedes albopictus]
MSSQTTTAPPTAAAASSGAAAAAAASATAAASAAAAAATATGTNMETDDLVDPMNDFYRCCRRTSSRSCSRALLRPLPPPPLLTRARPIRAIALRTRYVI